MEANVTEQNSNLQTKQGTVTQEDHASFSASFIFLNHRKFGREKSV